MLAKRSIAAAVAWARKYLVAASTARGWECRAMRGMMAKVLISRPIQARSQWELAKVRVVPRPSPERRMAKTYGFISIGRTLTNMFGVWAQKLILADFTRKWCSGGTESFDLSGLGSNPFFLRSWRGFNPHDTLYQSGPFVQAQVLGYSTGGRPARAIGRARCQITRASVKGRKFFQMRCMSWSYRNRGHEARTHKKTTDSRAALVIRLIAVSVGRVGR